MKPEIIVTDETRLILESYLQKQHERRAKREAKKQLEMKELEANPRKPLSRAVLVNPMNDHMESLEEIKNLLREYKSANGTPIQFNKEEANRVLAAARYVETAVELLNSLKKKLVFVN